MSDPSPALPCASSGRAGPAAIAACALAIALLVAPGVLADARRLECELTRVQTKIGADFEVSAESKPFTITFDEDAKTLAVERDSRTQLLDRVTMTPITMTGYIDDLSLGVDRSSWSVVLQTYGTNSINSEFGICTRSVRASP